MKVTKTRIPGVLIIEPEVHHDERGMFFESFNQLNFQNATGLDVSFVQDNYSTSRKGVLRGLHLQVPPYSQGKLVSVTKGEIFDVSVDLRKNSPTYGKWLGITISEINRKQVWIPKGFAHGFLTLSDMADVLYKVTEYYEPASERCLLWSDNTVNIEWPIIAQEAIVSLKDQFGESLESLDKYDYTEL